MIPKKIRREINISGVAWEYCVKGNWNKRVFAHNLTTNEKMEWYCEDCERPILPSNIKELILNKELWGIKAK